jgi:sporulation protein YlmC with PRC-barrel domain
LFSMLRIKKMSDTVGKHVYTSDGDYFGQIEEVNLADNKIDGWKIKISGGFMSVLGGAKGVIIPQQFVKAIGDIFIVNKTSLPSRDDGLEMPAGMSEAGESSAGFESF